MLHHVRTSAGAVGLGSPLRLIRRTVVPAARRGHRDDEHLRLLLAFLLRPTDTCVDVGAHTGGVLALMTRYAPRGRHVAFEPLPRLCQRLVDRFPTVDVRATALSDIPGRAEFTYVVSRPAYSGLRSRDYPGDEATEVIEVDVQRLDEALPAGCAPRVIKLDTEGAELAVLRGGVRTLRAHKPTVVLEFGSGAAPSYGATPEDLHDLLVHDVGLRIFDLDGNGPYSAAQLRETFDHGPFFNFVAHE